MRALLLLLATALAQKETTIDPSVLTDIFGTPPTDTGSTTATAQVTVRLEDQTIRTTDSNTRFTDSSGEPCTCVPYYLCDADLNGVDINNETVTGWGKLDIRFGEEECQESVERCCVRPRAPPASPAPPAPVVGCGRGNPGGLDVTITGGTGDEAGFGEYPWAVALLSSEGQYAGVGALLHPRVVITAAHVVDKFTPSTLKIRAGEWDTQTTKERLPHQERLVTEIVKHKDFHRKSLRYDFALLLLDSPVELAEHINVICMPEQDEDFSQHKNCVANGWGQDKFGVTGRYAVFLKRVEQDMVPHQRCNSLLQQTRLGARFKLHGTFVCAGGEEGKDTCKGDGGAPLACPTLDGRYKLSGLVAWGIGCGQKDVPAVYAAVATARAWVDQQMAAWGLASDGYTA